MEFYNDKIQLDKEVINDIFSNFKSDTKFLVFGLGYDSKMWYNGNKNTYFVENNDIYINMNNKDIQSTNIIKYDYENIIVGVGKTISDKEIHYSKNNIR